MGNEIEKCCRNCMKLQIDEFILETRFMEISNNFNKSLRCKKFYISSEPLEKHKINELLIFTDQSLTMTIPNFNLRLKPQDIQKLQENLKYEIQNNNLSIKENCFVINAIQQEIDSEYGEFKQFASYSSDPSIDKTELKVPQTSNRETNKQKLKNQIQLFALRNKSRAFRFKNPLKKYSIGQIIVAIIPPFEKAQDFNVLKQAVEQGLSMSEDLKSVAVSEISFMLGYEQSVFQKIILEYILGYSRSKKEYVFKRMNDFFYLTRSQQQMNSFLQFLNIYAKRSLDKIDSIETLASEENKKNIRKLGNNALKKIQPIEKNKMQIKQAEALKDQNIQKQNPQISRANESFGNTSFHSYQGTNLIGFEKQRTNNNWNTNINLSKNTNINLSKRFLNNDLDNNINDLSEIRSKISENTQIKNIRIKSFKSKQSNVSDYF